MSFYKLPDHLILDIFKNLYTRDLLSIRLVCKKWAEIVSDSIALRRKLHLFVDNALLNEEDPFVQTFLCSPYNICANIQFENVIVEDSAVVTELWSKIGPNIECLRMELYGNMEAIDCELDTDLYKHHWVALLKKTPNLIELDVHNYDSEDSEINEVIDEINLKKLKKVTLHGQFTNLNQYIMKILIKSANKVATLRFGLFSNKDFDTLYFLIESQRHSLKILKLDGDFKKKDWLKYLSIDNLSLEVVKFNSATVLDRDLLELLGNHKNLRELKACIDSSESYKQYPTYLSKVEKLDLIINVHTGDTNFSMPKRLNNLKSLKMNMAIMEKDSIIRFAIPTSCPTLEVLEICNGYKSKRLFSASVQGFVDNFPNLKVLNLGGFTCDYQIMAAIADKLVHLKKFVLGVHVTKADIEKMGLKVNIN